MGKKKKNRIPLKDLSKLAEDEGLYFNRELSWIKFNEGLVCFAGMFGLVVYWVLVCGRENPLFNLSGSHTVL